MVVHVAVPTKNKYFHGSGGPKSGRATLEGESTEPPLRRTTMALWVREREFFRLCHVRFVCIKAA